MGWVPGHAVAIFSGLLAAFCAAVGIVVRQRASQTVPAGETEPGALVTTLVREPWWWAGTLASVAGYVFQALALVHGSLLLVQPLLVSSLLFALPLSARLSPTHQPLGMGLGRAVDRGAGGVRARRPAPRGP
jgi:hypothetical protein